MTTIAPRIQITTAHSTRRLLSRLAKRDKTTLSAKAAELMEIGLSLAEDVALGDIARERIKTPVKEYISHTQVWG